MPVSRAARKSYRAEIAGRREDFSSCMAACRARLAAADYREVALGIRRLGRTRDPRRIHRRNAGKNAIEIAREIFRHVATYGELSDAKYLLAIRLEIAKRTLD